MNLINRLLTIIFVLILGLASYFFIGKYLFQNSLTAVDVVSGDALFVFETTEPVMAWNQLVNQPIWERLRDIPSVKNVEDHLVALDSLAGKSGNLEKSLKGNDFIVSLHRTGKEEFDFLFSVAFSGGSHHEFIQSLVEKVDPENINSRMYSGVTIYEYFGGEGVPALTYALIDNVVVASFSSFLIEDAIRHTETDGLQNFKETFAKLYQSRSKPQGLGILRLSSAGVAKLLQGISSGRELNVVDYLSTNGLIANLEIGFSKNRIKFDGISFFREGELVELTWNEAGETNPFNNFISNRTVYYHQYDVVDPLQIKDVPNKAFENKSTVKGEIEKSFDQELFLGRLTGEIGYMVLEENGLWETNRILLMNTEEVNQQISLLKAFHSSISRDDSGQLDEGFYFDEEIFKIGAENFPAHIFEGHFVGFKNTYVMPYEGMLVMGNSLKALQIFLDDVYKDNTWGKSIHHKPFLESISAGTGYRFILNFPGVWDSLVALSAPEWKVLFQKYAPQFKSIDWLTLNFDHQSAHLEFQYNLDPIRPVKDVVLAEKLAVDFSERLIYGPKAIQNFNDRSSDYLVQDELHDVHLVTDEGDVIFSQSVEGEIISDVFQIDYYKNGKLQLLFATPSAIYAIDRLGVSLPGYPIRIPSGSVINQLNVVDYDNSRDYRYFTGTTEGELFLFGKNGESLEGWDPKYISSAVANRPGHHRLTGDGDFMVAINSTGDLYLWNRKGELQTGNPINLGKGISTDYTLIERGGASQTQLVTINDEGEVVRANFNGELTYRNQLLRPDRNTRFHLVKDQSANRHLFILHEYNKISILNEKAEKLFEKGMFSDELSFQFFSFGGNRNIFVVIDKVQEFIYLYNLQGDLLNTRPISGYQNVEIKYSGSNNEYSILAIHGNRFSEYKMPL